MNLYHKRVKHPVFEEAVPTLFFYCTDNSLCLPQNITHICMKIINGTIQLITCRVYAMVVLEPNSLNQFSHLTTRNGPKYRYWWSATPVALLIQSQPTFFLPPEDMQTQGIIAHPLHLSIRYGGHTSPSSLCEPFSHSPKWPGFGTQPCAMKPNWSHFRASPKLGVSLSKKPEQQ